MDINIHFKVACGLSQEAKEWFMAALDDALAAQATEIKNHLAAAGARYQADLDALRKQITDLQATVPDPTPVVQAAFADVLSTIDAMDAPTAIPQAVLARAAQVANQAHSNPPAAK